MKSPPAPLTAGSLLLAAALAAAPAAQAQDAPSIQGTWTGRIGNEAVNACFTPYHGHYYHQRYLKGIPLAAEDGNWKEPDAAWKISRVSEVELEGVWLGNGKRLTIHLSRVAPLLPHDECGAAYYAPVLQSIKYEYSDARVDALPLRIVKSPQGQAFELKGHAPAARQINDFTRRWLEQQAMHAFSCQAGGGEDWQGALTAQKVIGHYLLVAQDEPDHDCGGAHGSASRGSYLFDLRNGRSVDTSAWLAGGAASLKEAAEEADKPALRKLLEKLNPRQDCEDGGYQIGAPVPAAKGLRFATAYPDANRACNDEIEVGYGKLAPFLSAEGKAFARSLKR